MTAPNPTATAVHRWLTQAEAGDYLGVTDRTIRNYISSGLITGYRMGSRAVRVDAHEIDNVLRRIPTAQSGGPDAA